MLILFICILPNCGNKISSIRTDEQIIIDGMRNDWQNRLYFLNEQQIGYGITNDDENLYICITTSNRGSIFQIAGQGFTIWIDPKGGKRKTFGIHFPLGQKQLDIGKMHDFARENQLDRRLLINSVTRIKYFNQIQTEYEIIKKGRENEYRSLSDNDDIKIKFQNNRNSLIYEIKIPFSEIEENFSLVKNNNVRHIGIGFVSKELLKPGFKGNGVQMVGRGQGRGGRGTSGNLPGGMKRDKVGVGMQGKMNTKGNRNQLKPIDYWVKVGLAK